MRISIKSAGKSWPKKGCIIKIQPKWRKPNLTTTLIYANSIEPFFRKQGSLA